MNIVLWLITLIAFILVMYIISYETKESFTDILPVSTGGLILVLYVLAFFRAMYLISAIAFLFICFVVVNNKKIRAVNEFEKNDIKQKAPDIICIFVFITVIAILTSKHIATWWDDLNYWATDAKALYFLNGFPGKYGNVAPEFGDYPPGIQIFKWCFLKLKGNFDEGLSYSGYYVMMVIFLLPLLKNIQNKNILIKISGLILIFLFPAICNIIWTEGACADVVMGIVFGDLLIAICDNKDHGYKFYYGRIAVYLSLVLLCKSSGFQWGIYAVIFLIGVYLLNKKTNTLYSNLNKKYLFISVFTGVLVQFSWWGYCLLNRRIAKLTTSGVHMAANGYTLPDNTHNKAKLFTDGFLFYPAHTNKSLGIDLSSAGILAVIIISVVLLILFKKLSSKSGILLCVYMLIVGVSVYLAIFVAHISIFQGETQYETADVMAISISRYASPYTIGMLMLIIYIVFNSISFKAAAIICTVFILCTTNFNSIISVLFSYHANVIEEETKRDDVIDDNGYEYINKTRNVKELYGHRVLYLRDNNTIHWIKDTYINYYASPVPTVYDGFDPAIHNTQDIIDMLNKNHAQYLYVDPVDGNISGIFDTLVNDDEFNYGTIYKIISDNNHVYLQKIGG